MSRDSFCLQGDETFLEQIRWLIRGYGGTLFGFTGPIGIFGLILAIFIGWSGIIIFSLCLTMTLIVGTGILLEERKEMKKIKR